jgi:isocitrate dehydrogenase kinase/phosphatase
MRLFYAEEEPDPHDKAERYDIQVIRDLFYGFAIGWISGRRRNGMGMWPSTCPLIDEFRKRYP